MSATSSDGRDTRAALQAGGSPWAHSLGHQRREAIERAHDLADGLGGDAGVERRGVELGVPKQDLDHPNIDVLLEQMRRKAVTQGVRGHPLADLGHVGRGMAGARELARRHRVDRVLAREQPALWPRNAIPVAQKLEQMRGKHHVAILAALALLDAHHHAFAVDVGYLQRDDLGHAQSCPVGDTELY